MKTIPEAEYAALNDLATMVQIYLDSGTTHVSLCPCHRCQRRATFAAALERIRTARAGDSPPHDTRTGLYILPTKDGEGGARPFNNSCLPPNFPKS